MLDIDRLVSAFAVPLVYPGLIHILSLHHHRLVFLVVPERMFIVGAQLVNGVITTSAQVLDSWFVPKRCPQLKSGLVTWASVFRPASCHIATTSSSDV